MNVFSDAIARGENVDDLAVHLDQLFANTPRRGVPTDFSAMPMTRDGASAFVPPNS
jgi:hypothetical protein